MARKPKPVTAVRVMRWSQWYLERWSSTEKNLARILWKKARRSMAEHGGDETEIGGWIQDAVAHALKLGWVNDERLAADIVRAQRRRGASNRKLRTKLYAKGVPAEIIERELAVDALRADQVAAALYARRRSVGPWRRKPVDREGRNKELAKLARAGFSFDIARMVVDAESPEELANFDA